MSSEGSVSTSSFGIRQFGLYRTIDAKTEEFLRLSRKRQIKQGCACAAISTAITVTIVVVVLLIYEYMIVVETQKKTLSNIIKFTGKDTPIAEKLDRRHFGFDQDYYERMPLLVNAMEEISHADPLGQAPVSRSRKRHYSKSRLRPSTTVGNRFVKKNSPRPFIFEYRSPYPMPFSKNQGNSKSWVEHYRNAQRSKNLHDVVKYLEKTLNAKFGDVHLPTRAQIAFSGVYVPPIENLKQNAYSPLSRNSSQNFMEKSNHNSDPLYIFRPDSPGDVNLLADGLKFAPSIFSPQRKYKNTSTLLVYRPANESQKLQNCKGTDCEFNKFNGDKKPVLETFQEVDTSIPQLFDIKLNVFSSPKTPNENILNKNKVNKIYITTPRPVFQFKKKYTIPFRRSSNTYKRPNLFIEKKKNFTITSLDTRENKTIIFKRLIPLSAFTTNNVPVELKKIENNCTEDTNVSSALQSYTRNNDITNLHPVLNFTHVEDYHVGSSGVIPVESRTSAMPTEPITVPITPLTPAGIVIRASTNPPHVIKFSPEDAKIPDHYLYLEKSNIETVTESKLNKWDYSGNTEKYSENIETETLIIKLKNIIETTTVEDDAEEKIQNAEIHETENEEESDSTTIATYVPQINGHYRTVNYKSLTTLLRENSERYRKKRLEHLVTIRSIENLTNVPMYKEISRNNKSSIRSNKNDD